MADEATVVTPVPPQTTPPATVDIEAMVKAGIEEALKPMKANLDSAYGARDAALKKAAELEQKQKDLEIEKLTNEGKIKEVLELQLAEEKAKREAVERRNVELSRDAELRTSLSALPFRNEKSLQMAQNELLPQLTQVEGVWRHITGISVAEAVKKFHDDTENSFLFKPLISSGPGADLPGTIPPQTPKKSLFKMSQKEVMDMAAKGALPKRK
jgi:hypothetical protein